MCVPHGIDQLSGQARLQPQQGLGSISLDDHQSSTDGGMQLLDDLQYPSSGQLVHPLNNMPLSPGSEQHSCLPWAQNDRSAMTPGLNSALCNAPELSTQHSSSHPLCLQPASQALTKDAATVCYTSADTAADLNLGASAPDLPLQLRMPVPRGDHNDADPSPRPFPLENPEQLPWWSRQLASAREGTNASLRLSPWDLTALRLEQLGVDAPAPDPDNVDDILARVSRAQGLDLAGGCDTDRLSVMDSSPFPGPMSGTCECTTARDMPGKASCSHSSPDQAQEDMLHADVQSPSGIGSSRDCGNEDIKQFEKC